MDADNLTKIMELIKRGGIYKDVEGDTPEVVFSNLCKMMDLPDVIDREQVYNALCAREKVLSTAIGNGIALPHARNSIIKDESEQRICIVYLKNPMDMSAPDERKVYAMFVLLTQNSQLHLKILATLAELIRSLPFRKLLESKPSADEIEAFIKTL
ncbi:MAG: PTS sugar transporter subunit IIA [Treponema sp.]|jgi:nitrogen PTS system EIIA component|nr:PTS sugar transporter subunit IIA [Treponema sp.]